MNVYITKINGTSIKEIAQYIQAQTVEIAGQLGCREMGVYRYNADSENPDYLHIRIDGIIAGISAGDIVICQFPTGNGLKFERTLISHIKAYHGRIGIFVHDLEALAYENRYFMLQETVGLYNQAEVLIVPTYAMQKYLLDNGVRKGMKFIVQEMWDYTVQDRFFHKPAFRKEIHITDRDSAIGIKEWNYPVLLNLYDSVAIKGQNVRNIGETEPDRLFPELLKGGFGLVWYRDEYFRRYMEYNVSFSLAKYLAAGIPVIVPAGISNCSMIEENHLGLVVNSLEEAAAMIETMKESEYQKYVDCIKQFAPAVRNCYFTKKCLIAAMQAFYRQDAGRELISKEVYRLGDCTFISTVLNESYGGNLAFSWDFQGEADGFLIYDSSMKAVLCDIKNEYQHYSILRGDASGNGFVITAYVETLRGKLIVAESDPTYLLARKYDRPKVSVIIPTYNAEDYISRSIDTVLAQAFLELEIIVVDDGSTDHTQEIIKWYTEKYKNVAAIYQENKGVAAARNSGIIYANGEYIGFLDSDDMLRPDMVGRLYDSARRNNCDIAITSAYRIIDNGYEKFLQYSMPEDVAVETDAFFDMHFTQNCMFATVIWNKLYRASLVKAHLIPLLTCEDGAWTPYILSYTDKICYLNDCSYEWDRVIRDSTLMDKIQSQSKEKCFEMYKDTVMFYLKNSNPKRLYFLKMLAKKYLRELGRAYRYDKYEKLCEQIDEMF